MTKKWEIIPQFHSSPFDYTYLFYPSLKYLFICWKAVTKDITYKSADTFYNKARELDCRKETTDQYDLQTGDIAQDTYSRS